MGMEIQKNVLPYIAILPSEIEKSHFVKSVAQKAFIKEDALWSDLQKIGTNTGVYVPKPTDITKKAPRVDIIERKVIGVIMWQKANKEGTSGVDIKDIEKRAKVILGDRLPELYKQFESEKDLLLFETEAYYNNKTNLSNDIAELLINLEEEYLKKQLSMTMEMLQKAEQTKDSSEVLKYLEECQRISQKINIIKQVYEKK